MDDPLTGDARRDIPADCHYPATRSTTDQTDIVDTARDADLMMRMIVGSMSVDPDDVRQRIEKESRLSHRAEKQVNMRLVILAVGLIFLVFGLDLIFLKM